MADLGTAYVKVAPNMTGIQGKIAAGFKGSAGPATAALGDEVEKSSGPFQSALGKLGGFAKGAGVAIGAGLAAGAVGLATLTSKMLTAGAELEQQLGGSEAVFGEYAKNVQNVALTAYEKMGLSQNEFLQGANKMGSLFQGAGFDVQSSMKMSTESMQRASDIASIMGISTTDALEAVTGMAKGNFTMMDNLGVAMNDTAIGAYALSKGINKSTAQMSIQEKVGLAQQMFMEKTAKYAGNYAKENETLAGSINTTKKAFQDFLAGGNSIEPFIKSLVNTIKIAVPQITAILPEIVNGLGQVLTALVPALSAALPVLIPALINAVTSLLNALVAAFPTIVQVLVNALPMLINAFIQLFLAIIKALPQIIAIIAKALPTIIDAIVNGLTAPESIQAIIMGAVQLLIALVKAIPIIIPALIGAIPTILRNIVATLTSGSFIGAMINAGVQLIQGVISGIVRTAGAVGGAAMSIVRTIGDALNPGNLVRIGSDVIRGLWNGIQSMGGWIASNVKSLVTRIIPDPIRKALGIHSPSRVAASLGKEVPAGLALGMDKSAGLVEKAATNIANSAIATLGSPIVSPSVAFGATASGGFAGGGEGSGGPNIFNIENVNLGDATAVREWFNQVNRDTVNVGMGLTPNQGAQPS